jgi:hypothetical protein
MSYPFEGEVRLLRWGESSSAGRTITLELSGADSDSAHPFRGLPTGHQRGQRFLMSFVPIDDNEKPLPNPGEAQERRPEETLFTPEGRWEVPSPPPAGALHPKDTERSRLAKEHYKSLSERDRAVADAGKLAKDKAFQAYAAAKAGHGHQPSVEVAKSVIYAECGISSRSAIATSETAYKAFLAFKEKFERASGRLPEPR